MPDIFVKLEVPKFIGYADRFFSTPVTVTVEHDGPVLLALSGGELVPPVTARMEAGEREMKFYPFSPVFLSENDTVRRFFVRAEARAGRNRGEAEGETVALPFDWWEGLGGEGSRLAAFVRPRLPDLSALRAEVEKKCLSWGEKAAGYHAPQSAVKRTAAAIFSCLRAHAFSRERGSFDRPSRAGGLAVTEKQATPLTLAVLACSLAEGLGLHPVLAVGRERAAVGIWLYESSFLSPVQTDGDAAVRYLDGGNLCFFDADDLFAGERAGFAAAEERCRLLLAEGEYRMLVDIFRCRAEGISPCPVRTRGKHGFEIYREEEYGDCPPAPLSPLPLPPADRSRGKEWEGRLCDLSSKNALVDFTGKGALRLAPAGDMLLAAFKEGSVRLSPAERLPRPAVLSLSCRQGILPAQASAFDETASSLLRRARESEEETGSGVLYVALGLVSYPAEGKRAPLLLVPVSMERKKGGMGYVLTETEPPFVNFTMLEFFKREFDLSLGGLETLKEVSYAQLLAAVRAVICPLEGWRADDAAYLALFPFQRYLLWKDLRDHLPAFSENAVVKGLLTGRVELPAPKGEEVLLPLPADSAQTDAVSLAAAGGCFVLYGPPGTGKSQTLANIIANAVYKGKRVLFVAEKRAACEVVIKRLREAGVGEFCLMLHARDDRKAALSRLKETLSLKEGRAPAPLPDLSETAEELEAAFFAMRRKREGGLSVRGAVCTYLDNRNAPDCFSASDRFFDGLTGEGLAECREEAASAAAAARECLPFSEVMLTEWTEKSRSAVLGCAETLLAEVKHLRGYLSLVAAHFRTPLKPPTKERVAALCGLLKELMAEGVDLRFYRANARFDEAERFLSARFPRPIPYRGCARLKEYLSGGGDPRLDRRCRAALSRLSRGEQIEGGDEGRYLSALVSLDEAASELLTFPLSENFSDRAGRVDIKKKEEAVSRFVRLEETGKEIFDGFDAELFFMQCALLMDTMSVSCGLLRAAEGYHVARDMLASLIRRADTGGGDMLEEDSSLCRALIDNIDLLPRLCAYRRSAEKLSKAGILFSGEAGKYSEEEVRAGFEKEVSRRFLERAISADPALFRLTVGSLDETAKRLRRGIEEHASAAKETIRAALLSRLPKEGELAEEVALLSHMKEIDGYFSLAELPSRLSPCLVMSPASAARYLPPTPNGFDLVVLDEASQLSAAEAVGALARGRAAVIAGDPNQLPPTSFFRAENGHDIESVLDECLAAGLPSRRLVWHYRSRHESLIAFSNALYYGNALLTPPSPSFESRVRLIRVDGVYERGEKKCNRPEAEALVREVIRRLRDPEERKKSMGVVTFSGAQRDVVEKILARELAKSGLEEEAFGRAEPLFVKNLENVQGDERDVVLFSVCYGPDAKGRLTRNFGPLNRAGGWRRLNVAVSRAREEMLVFSSMDAADVGEPTARGAAGLKALLAYAAGGVLPERTGKGGDGLAAHIAAELKKLGYECDLSVGSSQFRVDVAVRGENSYLLGILTGDDLSVKDSFAVGEGALLRAGWKVARVNSVSYFNNPRREIGRIKELLGAPEKREEKRGRPYRFVRATGRETSSFVTDGKHDGEISARLAELVAVEEPISRAFLKKRLLESFGICDGGTRAAARLDELIDGCRFPRERAMGEEYFYRTERALRFSGFRVETARPLLRKSERDYSVYDTVALLKDTLAARVSLYPEELAALLCDRFEGVGRSRLLAYLEECIAFGEQRGLFVRSPSDRISLA